MYKYKYDHVCNYPISTCPLSHITNELNLIYTAPFVWTCGSMFLLGYGGLSWPGQPKVQTEYNSKSYLWKRSDKRGGDRRLSFDVPAWTPSSCPGGRFLCGTLRPPWPPLTAASTTDPSSSPPLWTRPGWRGCRRCPGPGHKPSRYFKHCVSKHQREAKGKIVSFLSSNCNNTSVWISNAASNQLMPASFTRLRSESVSKPRDSQIHLEFKHLAGRDECHVLIQILTQLQLHAERSITSEHAALYNQPV